MPIDIRKTINEAETFFLENGPYGVVAEQAPEKAIPWVYQPERGKDRATKYPGKGDVFIPPVSKYCTVAWKFPTPSILLFFLRIFLSLALSLTKLSSSFFLFPIEYFYQNMYTV